MTKGEITKDKLLESAIILIAEYGGTESVTFRAIARRAGVPASRIVYYFKNRVELLVQASDYAVEHTQLTPVTTFLAKNESLLTTHEGQSFFINDLFSALRRMFHRDEGIEVPGYDRALRLLLQSSEIPPQTACRDARELRDMELQSFYTIYQRITGVDNFEQSCFWYLSTIHVLIHRLSGPRQLQGLDNEHPFSKNYNIRFLYFCRRRLLMGLGLWEEPNVLISPSAAAASGVARKDGPVEKRESVCP